MATIRYDNNVMGKHHFHAVIIENMAAVTVHKYQVQFVKVILSMQMKGKPLFTPCK